MYDNIRIYMLLENVCSDTYMKNKKAYTVFMSVVWITYKKLRRFSLDHGTPIVLSKCLNYLVNITKILLFVFVHCLFYSRLRSILFMFIHL